MAEPSPWNQAGMANSLADAIRQQANTQAALAQNKPVPGGQNNGMPADPLEQLMKQIQGINVKSTPYDVLMQQAQGSAGAQYDPLIKQLQAEMARTQQRGTANQNTARQMYGDLATEIASEMPQITQQMAAASKETENRYNETQQQLAGQYNQQANQQAELLKKLGIQAAAPEASQQAMEDQTYFQNQSNSEEASALQMLQEMKNSDLAYQRQSSNNTRLAGQNVAQDIGAQLEDYMQSAGGKLAGLNAGRESAISAMLAQLQQQDAQRVSSAEEAEYKRMMEMFNLQLKMQEMQNKMSGSGDGNSLFKGTNGPSGASNYLGGIYGGQDTFSSKAIMEAITDVMSSKEAVAGKYQSPDMKDGYNQPVMMDVTPDYLTDMLRKRMQEGDPNTPVGNTTFSDYDVNNAINALLAYMGKLK
ncbi:hypothetical protein [Chitinophaga sp.]|uniref:hypothetical protein n=1 Tax=Chitinophaga sp. TaxID=1869181 RepID=UPI002F9233CE